MQFKQKLSYFPKGFTLIELLVVVLIIGILAAVALPQYQAATMKSRFTQLQTAGDSFIKSYYLYRLATGEDPKTFDQLDILPLDGTLSEDKLYVTSGDTYCQMYENAKQMICRKENTPDFVFFFPTYTAVGTRANKRFCRGFTELEKKVCLKLGATHEGDGSTYSNYILP